MAHTSTTITAAIAATLGVASADVEIPTAQEIADGLQRANNEIEAILIGERGYTVADVAAWDLLDDFVKSLSRYFVFLDTADNAGIAIERIDKWDIRKELRKIAILNASEEEVEAAGLVAGGALDDGEHIPTALDDSETYFED